MSPNSILTSEYPVTIEGVASEIQRKTEMSLLRIYYLVSSS